MNLIAVALGGSLGALARYGLSTWAHRVAGAGFPVGTLLVNVLGCLVIGATAFLVEERQVFSAPVRHFVHIGFLGSLTTFSTFGIETFDLVKAGEWPTALGSVLANFVVGLGAVALGWYATRAMVA